MPFPFLPGTVPDISRQTTLFNVLQHYNPFIIGGSSGSTDPGSNHSRYAGMNFATTGASIKDADHQAQMLVSALRYRILRFSFFSDTDFFIRAETPELETVWKLVTFQFGVTDLCSEPGEQISEVCIVEGLDCKKRPETMVRCDVCNSWCY